MITKLWYSVQNGGDGSAYPVLMESEALCELDQKFLDESWGEPCLGCFRIESESPIKVLEEAETVDSMIAEVEEELAEDYIQEYRKAGEYPEMFVRLDGKLEALKKLRPEDPPTCPWCGAKGKWKNDIKTWIDWECGSYQQTDKWQAQNAACRGKL